MIAVRRRLALVIGTVLVSAAACSDSTAPNDSLTPDETSELAFQMGAHLSGGLSESASSSVAGGPLLNAIPEPFSGTVNATVPCPRGGITRVTGTVNGTFDAATKTGTVNVTATNRPDDCGYDVHGKTIRVSGSLTATAHAEIENGLPVGTHTASLVGEFNWRASDGRRGTCSVNYSATANYDTNVASVSGNFCGSTVQFTGPLTTD
jgi:hypothetical protein